MYVNLSSAALQAYQPSTVGKISSATTATTEKTSENTRPGVTTFESLLTENDKRTLAAMESLAKEKGVSEKEMERLKVAIAGEKFLALDQGYGLQEINKNMMTRIVSGAGSGRLALSSSTARLFYDNFIQLKGIDIKA